METNNYFLHNLCILVVTLLVCKAQELFRNPGMESSNIEEVYGHAWGYTVERVSPGHTGSHAVKISGRTAAWMGIGQDVTMRPNTAYSIHAYVKQLNNNTKFWQGYHFSASYQWTADSNDKTYTDYARHSFGTVEEGWFMLGGDFVTPAKPWHIAHLYIQGPDPGIEFLADDFSLQEIPTDANWKPDAYKKIEQIRKTNFSLSVTVDSNFDPHHVELEIKLRSHEFAFGSVVEDRYIINPDYKIYQNIFYEFFNWATVQSYKWHHNKNPQYTDYDGAVQVTKELLRQGLHVRGHNMFWGVPQYTPDWIRQLSPSELRKVIHDRLVMMTNITYGILDHWDVNNELLHGQEYEEITRDPVYSQEIYREVHARDPKPKLFLNDYDVVAEGAATDDYVNQGNTFKAANVGLYGLGVQSHFRENVEPKPSLLKYRLDKLATTGLPMWVTELTLNHADENTRADWFEQALTSYFSHPSIEGIIFWGFWDHGGTSPDGALVNGNALHINAAGQRYLNLTKNTWSTNIKTTLTSKLSTIDLNGFYGDYDVIVRYLGKAIDTQKFSLYKQNHARNFSIHVHGNGDEITLPTSRPTYAPVHHVHLVTHDHTEQIGHVNALTSGTSSLTCITRYSGLSAVGDDKTTEVTCNSDEVMTGCSSITKDLLSFRDGEYFMMRSGAPVCRAVNAWRSSAPVQAMARCCKKTGLQCTYMKAGPSGTGREDQIEVICPRQTIPLGCTSYTYYGSMDGSLITNNSCIAQNDGVQGVFTYGACCSAPSLQCQVRMSDYSGLHQGATAEVTCHSGENLVSCSVYSEDGNTAGTVPNDTNVCQAFNGLDRYPGEQSVKAVAVCCR